MRTALLSIAAVAVGLGAAVPAHAVPRVTLPIGQSPGVAVDAGGTAHVAWKVEGQDNAVFSCTVPRGARGCAGSPVPVPFPGEGFNLGEVTVLPPQGDVIEIVVSRQESNDYGAFLARSTDGGRSFAPGFRIHSSPFIQRADRAADGRIALVGGSGGGLKGGLAAPTGADAAREMTELGGEDFSTDVAAAGNDAIVLGGGLRESRAFLLPAGAPAGETSAWQPLPVQDGGRGVLATGPAGTFAMLDSEPSGQGVVYAQRLQDRTWSSPVRITAAEAVQALALDQDADGRLHGLFTDELRLGDDVLFYATSGDGGVRWSAPSLVSRIDSNLADLALDTAPDGEAVAVVGVAASDRPLALVRIPRRRVPAASVRVGGALVEVRARCTGGRGVTVEVRASRDGRAVGARSVLRGATFSSRTAQRRSVRRFSTRLRLRRSSAVVRVRLRPRARGERARTVRVRALRCGAAI